MYFYKRLNMKTYFILDKNINVKVKGALKRSKAKQKLEK